jgi:hypothetical protein
VIRTIERQKSTQTTLPRQLRRNRVELRSLSTKHYLLLTIVKRDVDLSLLGQRDHTLARHCTDGQQRATGNLARWHHVEIEPL